MSLYYITLSCIAKDHAQAKEIESALAITSLGTDSDYLDVKDEGVEVKMEGDFDDRWGEYRDSLVSVIARFPEAKFEVWFDSMDNPEDFWKEEYQGGHSRLLKGVKDYVVARSWTPVTYRAVKDYVGEHPDAHFKKGDYCNISYMSDGAVNFFFVVGHTLQFHRLAFDEYFEAVPKSFGEVSMV